jgi:hypothetical protein
MRRPNDQRPAVVKRPEHIDVVPIVVTVGMISLISLAVGTHLGYSLITLATVAAGVAVFYVVFPGSRFFSIALANSLAVYACIFIFFTEANFETVDPNFLQLGFTLPILAFLGGTAARFSSCSKASARWATPISGGFSCGSFQWP